MTYFFILPYSLAFTIEFSFNVLGLDVYRPEAGNYYSTIIWMTFAVGIAFAVAAVDAAACARASTGGAAAAADGQ